MVRGVLVPVEDASAEQNLTDPLIVGVVWRFDGSKRENWFRRRRTLELIVSPGQWDDVLSFVSNSVELPVVLRLPREVPDAFWSRIGAASNVFVKLAGLIGSVKPHTRQVAAVRPFVQSALTAVGPDRLIFGSDWPRCVEMASWKEVLAAFTQAAGAQPMAAREQMLGGAAMRAYLLTETSLK